VSGRESSDREDGSPLAKSRAFFARGLNVNRLTGALIAYVVLGVLTWLTISDSRIRGFTFAILAMFALKSILRRKDVLHTDDEKDADGAES
jgi:hypothetical protein